MSTGQHSASHPNALTGVTCELPDALASTIPPSNDDPSSRQIEIYRRMTPGRRLEVAEQLYWSARELKRAWFRTQHPDWTVAEVEAAVTRNFSHAGS